ncbi:MAG: hypothetical protein HOP18_27840 [Deltaproteobacteria bacterium]|nr:hypothetical protein [Deltaproteobacteria bacterium]
MQTRYVTLGIALLMLTGIVGAAEAKDQHVHWKASFSGGAVNTQSDTNGDGSKGGFDSGGFKGTLGSGTFQGVNEYVFSGPGTCPNGNEGFIVTLLPGTGHSFYRFDNTGDLLFVEISSSTLCFDPITTLQFYSWVDNITGGTGRFAGATGSITGSGTAKTLFDDGAGNFLAAISSTAEGTIILTK